MRVTVKDKQGKVWFDRDDVSQEFCESVKRHPANGNFVVEIVEAK